MEKETKGHVNVNFRQTPKEFRSARQAQNYAEIKRNIPYRIFIYTKGKLSGAVTTLKSKIAGIKMKLPKEAKRIR